MKLLARRELLLWWRDKYQVRRHLLGCRIIALSPWCVTHSLALLHRNYRRSKRRWYRVSKRRLACSFVYVSQLLTHAILFQQSLLEYWSELFSGERKVTSQRFLPCFSLCSTLVWRRWFLLPGNFRKDRFTTNTKTGIFSPPFLMSLARV